MEDQYYQQEIVDYKLRDYYQKRLGLPQYAYAKKLQSQKSCGSKLIRLKGTIPAVFVLANEKFAKIWGTSHCKSPWSCPVCSATQMSKMASRIASAIDALEEKYNEAGFMITFSVPHYHNFSCQQVYDILAETWKHFIHHAKSKVNQNPCCRFMNVFNCTHRIRVCEFTWGHYGWHPHFHCLFFVPKNRLQEVKEWQKTLSEYWFLLARRATIKILERDHYCENVENFVEDFYQKTNHTLQGVPDAYISLDESGKVRQAKSSQYICGWGADKELTGNIRKEASNKNHYTPYQLLQKAYELDAYGKTLDNKEATKYFNLYIDYALTTFKKYRVKMSPNIKQIIDLWRQTKGFKELLKKKLLEETQRRGKLKIVIWFNQEEWYRIYSLHLIPEILTLAKQINGKQLIEQLLLKHQINITKKPLYPPNLIKNLPPFIQEIHNNNAA